MKVFQVHNFYSSDVPSGENQVVNAERSLLRRSGYFCGQYSEYNDWLSSAPKIKLINAAALIPWNKRSYESVKLETDRLLPDVMHVHNTFPLISPSVFYAANSGVARVLTLHNYRIFCSAGIPLRDKSVCTECIDKRSIFPALKHGCYRNSRAATTPVAANILLHRLLGTWVNQVDAFICLSEFQKELMHKAGLPLEKLYVKPNFYQGDPYPKAWAERIPYIVYAGRLSEEKGVRTLLTAWRDWGPSAPELRIIGDGELRGELEAYASANNLPIKFLGRLESEDTQKQIGEAFLQILPSEWFETFGLVVIEAFAHGTPAAVSRIGALPSLVDDGRNGVVFEPFDPSSLLERVRSIWAKPDALEDLGNNARLDFESKYTESANLEMLLDIYQAAIERRKS